MALTSHSRFHNKLQAAAALRGLCIVNTAVTHRDWWAAGTGWCIRPPYKEIIFSPFRPQCIQGKQTNICGKCSKELFKTFYVEFLKGTLSLIVSRLCSGGKIQFRRINNQARCSAARQQHCPGVPSWSDPKILRLIARPRDKTPQKENYCSRPFLVLQNSEQM